jgi:hypothetical protein
MMTVRNNVQMQQVKATAPEKLSPVQTKIVVAIGMHKQRKVYKMAKPKVKAAISLFFILQKLML